MRKLPSGTRLPFKAWLFPSPFLRSLTIPADALRARQGGSFFGGFSFFRGVPFHEYTLPGVGFRGVLLSFWGSFPKKSFSLRGYHPLAPCHTLPNNENPYFEYSSLYDRTTGGIPFCSGGTQTHTTRDRLSPVQRMGSPFFLAACKRI